MRPTVLFLGGGSDAAPIIARGIAMGFKAVVLDYAADCPSRRLADEFILASCYDETSTLNALQEAGIRPDAALCAGVDAPHVAAAVACRYGIPGIAPETAALSRDKVRQWYALADAGVQVPMSWVDNPPAFSDKRWIVVKPADSRGARGVFRIPAHEAARYWDQAARMSPTGRVIWQEWAEGVQLSTESIVQNGKVLFTAIAERNYSRLVEFAPAVIEDGSDMPCNELGDPDAGGMLWKVEAAITLCAKALGLQTGILKGDMVWDGVVPTVIEVAARLSGGGFCSLMTPMCLNVDLVGLAIRQALGETIRSEEIKPYFRQHVCQRFRFPRRPHSHPDRGDFVLGVGKSRERARIDAMTQLEGR
jgi:biotin carboxylase